MAKKFKTIFFLVLSLILCLGFYQAISTLSFNPLSYDFYIANGYADTAAKNLIAAIYLDYRLFDSIFETSTLFVAAVGISFIATAQKKE